MATVVNNRETNEGDNVFYIDKDGKIHDAIIKSIVERDGNHYAEVKFEREGKKKVAIEVPHNTSPEKHSWNHPRSAEEVEMHHKEGFYGDIPFHELEADQEAKEEEISSASDFKPFTEFFNFEHDDTEEGDENA